MNQYRNSYIDTTAGNGTRIDMLLSLYDRAIATIRFAQYAKEANDNQLLTRKLLEANRVMLALHGGLNTEEFDMAVAVGQLLNFVMLRLEQHNFEEAVYFLEKLQTSFGQIRDEAVALERAGKIPPMSASKGLDTVA